ncbi:hypothetical protein AXF42_Ash015996 [Apostasia shenzhenica]|uniref:Uncharacterized protein n=1 Tax=Apostasia shenzhenica TaxID=1088818 RepID=A0A2I0AWL7_9ASPA|nr:hypothetical protein AXF42_Ash015996 [Apostasia shenzhenica]
MLPRRSPIPVLLQPKHAQLWSFLSLASRFCPKRHLYYLRSRYLLIQLRISLSFRCGTIHSCAPLTTHYLA